MFLRCVVRSIVWGVNLPRFLNTPQPVNIYANKSRLVLFGTVSICISPRGIEEASSSSRYRVQTAATMVKPPQADPEPKLVESVDLEREVGLSSLKPPRKLMSPR